MRKPDQVAEQSAAYLPGDTTERKYAAPAIITSFTPSIMGEATLRAIFVARQALVDRMVRDIRDATTTGARRHALLIGPRGIGKTHLVSMVYYGIRAEPEVYEKLRIAWLREEDWSVFSWADLLVAIFRALGNEYPAERAELFRIADRLRRLPIAESAAEGEQKLLEFLGDRVLLVIAENVNDLFEGMGRDGQQSLRAFLQNHSNAVLITTAPALTDDLSDYDAPFYGFFNTTHLKELTRPEARELLLKIARTNGAPDDLIEYLQTDEADRRLRVIEALAGGHPRIWILFSACMTKQLLDELVPLFVKMLDDLTPYYQERMRALPPQERRIVAFLCEKRGAVPVKEIAEACRLKPNAAAALLGKLEEKAYVRKAAEPTVVSVGDRRISYYEMREPLMRLCIEVKANRAEPLSLIVEFLRLWYDEEQIIHRLESLPTGSSVTRLYMEAALERISYVRRQVNYLMDFAHRNYERGQLVAALKKLRNVIKISPDNGAAWNNLGLTLSMVGRNEDAISCFNNALSLGLEDKAVWYNRGKAYANALKFAEALPDFDHALSLDAKDASAWFGRGQSLVILQRHDEALYSLDQAISISPNDIDSLTLRCIVLCGLDRFDEALSILDFLISSAEHNSKIIEIALKSLVIVLFTSQIDNDIENDTMKKLLSIMEMNSSLPILADALVGLMPIILNDRVENTRAEKWVSAWKKPGKEKNELKISLHLLESALEWKRTRDRGVLLRLPAEERIVLESMLAKYETPAGVS